MSAQLIPFSPAGPELRPEWSQHLVVDVALNQSIETICDVHGLTQHSFNRICENPAFVMAVATLRKQLEKEGATFKLKAGLQADVYLGQVHAMVMDTTMDPKVRVRLIESVARWAGFDTPQPVGSQGGMGGFSISINLGSSSAAPRGGITIDGDQ